MVHAVQTQQQATPRIRHALLGAAAAFMTSQENRKKVSALARFAGEITGLGPRLEALVRSSNARERVEDATVTAGQKASRAIDGMQRRNLSMALRTDAVSAIHHIKSGEPEVAERALVGLSKTIGRVPSLSDEQKKRIQSLIAGIEGRLGGIGDQAGSHALALQILEGDLSQLFFNDDRKADYVSILETIGARHE